jgi:tetratricopeptide (TPR) repeat protein
MDPMSIAMALALALGLLGADAALSANTLGVHINVPSELGSRGITREIAEEVFANEVARMAQTPSLLAPLEVRSSSEPTVIGAVAKALHLDEITFAMQRTIGLNPMRLTGTVMPADASTRFVMTASSSSTGSFMIDIKSVDSDYVELIRRAAQLTIERVSPYRAALYHFSEAAKSPKPDFSRTEVIAQRDLQEQLRTETVVRRAFFHNLLGIVALMRDDDRAADHFQAAIDHMPTLAAAHLNLAFLDVYRDRYGVAIERVKGVLQPKPMTKVPQLLAAAYTTWGVAAWALGRHDEAEAKFAQAAEEYWGTAAAYDYWGDMLIALGRTSEGEAKKQLAIANLPFFENFPEVALLYFDLDPADDSPLVRR